MNRNQHIYHFLNNDIYLPMPTPVSPYSVNIARSLTLCPDIIEPYDDVDNLCTINNTLTDLCKLVTTKGYWSPTDHETRLCTWKTGRPKHVADTDTTKGDDQERELFVVAVLPHPSAYLWRLWLSKTSLSTTNASDRMHEFDAWVIRQPHSLMLDAFIPPSIDEINIDLRITRIIDAMRSGKALVMTEKWIAQLFHSAGKDGIEKWISAHVGYFLTVAEPNVSSWFEPVSRMGTGSFPASDRFYSAIERENERWTRAWNSWRNK